MSKKYRPRKNRNSRVLFSADTTLGWKVIRRVSFHLGETNVTNGIWRRVNNAEGQHIGYQILCSLNSDATSPSKTSPTQITAAEMVIYGGRAFPNGQSRTAGLSEVQRAERRTPKGYPCPLEDAVERVTAKVEQWTHPASRVAADVNAPYGDRATRAYPRG